MRTPIIFVIFLVIVLAVNALVLDASATLPDSN